MANCIYRQKPVSKKAIFYNYVTGNIFIKVLVDSIYTCSWTHLPLLLKDSPIHWKVYMLICGSELLPWW